MEICISMHQEIVVIVGGIYSNTEDALFIFIRCALQMFMNIFASGGMSEYYVRNILYLSQCFDS